MRPIELRQGKTALHETFARRGEAEALSPLVAGLERAVARKRAMVARVKTIGPTVAQAARQRIERVYGPELGKRTRIHI